MGSVPDPIEILSQNFLGRTMEGHEITQRDTIPLSIPRALPLLHPLRNMTSANAQNKKNVHDPPPSKPYRCAKIALLHI
jgi:hypothetical protein